MKFTQKNGLKVSLIHWGFGQWVPQSPSSRTKVWAMRVASILSSEISVGWFLNENGYGKCPKIFHTGVFDKMAYANRADSDLTGAVWSGSKLFATQQHISHKKQNLGQKYGTKWPSKFYIMKPRLFKYIENFTTKTGKFSDKNSDIFYTSAQNIDCWYSLEPPRRGGSNEYPQSIIFSRNEKINAYPCKPQFYYIKVGFSLRGPKLYWRVFVMRTCVVYADCFRTYISFPFLLTI